MTDQFPRIPARSLDGVDVMVPDELPVGPRIVALAFQRWHVQPLATWAPAFDRLERDHPGLTVWEVPALSRVYLAGRFYIDGGMRAGTPDPEARKHTLTAYTDLGALAEALELPSLDDIYLFVLDEHGRIVFRTSGSADAEKIDQVEAAVRRVGG